MPLDSSLTVRGIGLRPWPRCSDFQMIQWRDYDGLVDMRDGNLTLIGIFADKPGRGHFDEFVTALEQACDENNASLTVSNFWSTRLRAWFQRRGYHLDRSRKLGKYAVRPACKLTARR
jgi:hypothetical protein